MSRLIPSSILLAAVLTFWGCGSAQEPRWREFRSEEHGFSVALPGVPTQESVEEQSRLSGMSGHRFTVGSERDGISHRVEYFDYPPSLIELLTRASGGAADKLMFAASRTLAREIGGEVVDEAEVSLRGQTGKEVRIEGPDGKVTLARFHFVGSRLYRLIVGGAESEPPQEGVRKFFDSFGLLEPTPSENPD